MHLYPKSTETPLDLVGLVKSLVSRVTGLGMVLFDQLQLLAEEVCGHLGPLRVEDQAVVWLRASMQ